MYRLQCALEASKNLQRRVISQKTLFRFAGAADMSSTRSVCGNLSAAFMQNGGLDNPHFFVTKS